MNILATATDPDGRRVELTQERWDHIVHPLGAAGHSELAPYQAEVLRAVSEPDLRMGGREANEEWFLLEGVGPSRWLQVVVAFEAGRGWIVTAFPRRSFPRTP